jgi:hypothetical protein
VTRLWAALVAGLPIVPAGASAHWPPPAYGTVVAQDLTGAWLVPAHGAVATFAGGQSVDYSRRLGLLAIARRTPVR